MTPLSGSSDSVCPYCGAVAATVAEEVEHMIATHRGVIAERLRAAGFVRVGDKWIDRLVDPADASG